MGTLTIVFVILKATGFLDWSWWVVVIPTMIDVAIVVLYFAFFVWHVKNL